jgi:hypothetical protein
MDCAPDWDYVNELAIRWRADECVNRIFSTNMEPLRGYNVKLIV